ncbi:uncharacterized protein CXorf38 homolog [Pholidichthys leucotaenia]
MPHLDLLSRLNDRGYTNWIKAGRCLLILKNGLHPLTDRHMRDFHRDQVLQNPWLGQPCVTGSCRASGNKLFSPCRVCLEWQTVIMRNHRHPDSTINWDNCFPPNWSRDHWEVAKAFMPRGQSKVKGSEQCDAPALLNLIHYCKYFSSMDPKSVKEVIRYRNELMHSSQLHVRDDWMGHFHRSLKHFVKQFTSVPEMSTVGKQIDEMMAVDLSINVYGSDRLDSDVLGDVLELDSDSQSESSTDFVSQWETELLQEMLQEFLQDEDDEDKTQDAEHLRHLGDFLQANRDLSQRFSAEIHAIRSLKSTK